MMTVFYYKGNIKARNLCKKFILTFVFVFIFLTLNLAGADYESKRVNVDKVPIVLFFGDSITAGYGVGLEAAYPSKLREIANAQARPFNLINAGLSGDTTAGGLRRIRMYLEKDFDIVFLALGANDGLRGLSPANMRDNLQAIIERVRSAKPGAKIILGGMEAPPNLGQHYSEEYRQAFRAIASEKDVVFIPFLLKGVAGDRALNLPDGIHPNEKGHEIIANNVWPFIENLLNYDDPNITR